MISIILLVFAFVLAVIAAWSTWPSPSSLWASRLICLALACYFLSVLLSGLGFAGRPLVR